ncbi:putative inositol transporter 3 [Capsicum annuum]|uniref:Inositol transporter 3 n=1 Tax=Capsicum annuum TaxID=4072 RepID=A0A2G2Y6A4_CAPAN|nr:putative inositol transporter 3 [Capsicum annuum]
MVIVAKIMPKSNLDAATVDKRFDHIEALMKKYHKEMIKQLAEMMSDVKEKHVAPQKVVTDINYSNSDVKKNETDSDELGTPKEQPKDILDKETSTEIKTTAFQESIDNIIVEIFSSVIEIQSVEILQKVNLPDLSLPTENTKVQNEPQSNSRFLKTTERMVWSILEAYIDKMIQGISVANQNSFDVEYVEDIAQKVNESFIVAAGAIFDATTGCWLNDTFGRKLSILIANVLFFTGELIMAIALVPWVIIIGMIFFGLGVGMASMTTLLYILEPSPHKIRGERNMGLDACITGLPSVIQLRLMLVLPESLRWLYRKGKLDESSDISVKIYPAKEVENEVIAMKKSVEEEKELAGSIVSSTFTQIKKAFGNSTCRRALYASIGVQVAQQFVGINTVMYYSPTIMQFSGFVSNKTVVALSFITSDLNVVRSIVSMAFIHRYGSRRLMIIC